MSEKGRKQTDWNRYKPKPPDQHDINRFRKEYERCIEDADFAAQTFSITLREAGWTDKEITAEINRVFWMTIKRLG